MRERVNIYPANSFSNFMQLTFRDLLHSIKLLWRSLQVQLNIKLLTNQSQLHVGEVTTSVLIEPQYEKSNNVAVCHG